jgi:hypothetical protein
VLRLDPTDARMKMRSISAELSGRQPRILRRTDISRATRTIHDSTTPQENEVNTMGDDPRTYRE